jgi:hypothetical protein
MVEFDLKYIDLVLNTINETYPKYQQQKVLKDFRSLCFLSEKHDLFTDANISVNVSEMGENNHPELQIINKIIKEKPHSIQVIEELEYKHSYKYATFFEINEFPDNAISNLISSKMILDSGNEDFLHDYCSFFNELDKIKPTYKDFGSIVALKFNQIVTGYSPIDGVEKETKYPILVLFFKEQKCLEIRFDTIKNYFKKGDDYFYIKQIDTVVEWLQKYLLIELEPLNLSPIVDFISKKNTGEVDVAAQAMNLITGSKVVLDTGVDEVVILPILGELKLLMNENEELFKSNKETMEIYEKLKNFIFETEETSDLPWISLRWRHETKSKQIKVKFSFNFKGQVYDVLQYYSNNADMERMNYVTRYLIENKNEYECKETESA